MYLESWTGIAAGTRIGHIHLHVSDLDRAESFYHGLLGFTVMTRSYPGALFLAAGGYHHHIGVNVWISAANPLPPDDAAGLLAFEVILPDPALVKRIRDDAKRRGVETIPARDGFRLRDQDGNGVVLRHL